MDAAVGDIGGRAIIVGAGIAGLSAAIALRDAGYAIAVYERSPVLRAEGTALSLWPNAIEALRRLGLDARVMRAAAPIERLLVAAQDDRPILGPRLLDSDDGVHRAFLAGRTTLHRILLDALGGDASIGCAEQVVGVDEWRGSVRMGDGRDEHADLIVIAGGIGSTIASRLIGTRPVAADYGGVLALSASIAGAPGAGLAAEYWGNHERFGVFDLGGGRRYWFYMRDSGAAEAEAPLSRAMLLRIADAWPATVRQAIEATPETALVPVEISARAIPRRLGIGRALCVGDAAHAMHPNLGQGACQALEDAAALAAIAARVPAAGIVTAFEAARLPRLRAIIRAAAQGRHGAHGPAWLRAAVRTGMRVMPAAIHDRVLAGMHSMPDYR